MIRRLPRRLIRLLPRRPRITISTALRDFRTHDPILIYQMGKVGSTTLQRTLDVAGLPNPVYHVHYLVPENVREMEGRRRERGVLNTPSSDHLAVGRGLWWRIRTSRTIRWQLITGVREPIARAISQIFQGARWRNPQLYTGDVLQPERVLELLFETIRPGHDLIEETYTWFDRELREAFGIDVYQHRFDREAGYQILEDGRVRLLIYRLEDIANVLSRGLGEFLNVHGYIPVERANIGSNKSYREAYLQVKSAFRLPPDRCLAIYDAPYMRHFYGPEATERLVRKWSH